MDWSGNNQLRGVMEGKSILFKEFANIDAWPICLATQDSQEIISTVRAISPVFGGINLEDISAPRCFEIENACVDLLYYQQRHLCDGSVVFPPA